MRQIDLSIVVLNYKTPQVTSTCLESILKSKTRYCYEIILLDNASQDSSVSIFRKKFPQVRIIAEKKNHGFAKGNNIAVRKARGKYILFLNTDTKIFPDTLQKALQRIAQDKKIGVLGVTLLNKHNSIQRSVFRFPSIKLFLADLLFLPLLRLYDDYRYFDYKKEAEVDFVSGAFLLMPRKVFEKVRGFDEDFFMYSEETDLCFRTKQAGYKIIYSPVTRIIHYGGGSGGLLVPGDIFHQSKIKYIRKHVVPSKVAFFILFVGLLERMILAPWQWRKYWLLARQYGKELIP